MFGGELGEGRDLELAAGGLCSGSFVWFEQEGQKSEASSHPSKICFPLLTARLSVFIVGGYLVHSDQSEFKQATGTHLLLKEQLLLKVTLKYFSFPF